MSHDHDRFTPVVEAWLDTMEASEDPAGVADRVSARLDSMPQRGSRWLALRYSLIGDPVRMVLTAAAVMAGAILAINLLPASPVPAGGPSPSPAASVDRDLGVFEPARGRVVFLVASDPSHLEAVDPADPSSSIVIDADLGGRDLMPAGWSADGSTLALTDEVGGDLYLMGRTGSLERLGPPHVLGDCPCRYITPAWMSPDGRKRLEFWGPSRKLRIFDLDDNRPSRMVDLEFDGWGGHGAWSPNGTQVALAVEVDIPNTAAVGVVDLASGDSRELGSVRGSIRHLTWSPNGAQVLAVALHDDPFIDAGPGLGNPFQRPQAASLYLVDVDDGEVHEIASGHYVAAAWSPDGTQIAAVDYSHLRLRQVVVLNADGSGRRVLANLPVGDTNSLFTGIVWHPVIAP